MSLDNTIAAILDPNLSMPETGQTMVVLNHLSQMKLFGIRQGIEFYPSFDDELGTRKAFIDEVVKANELDILHDRLWDLVLCSGQVLFYFRPNKKGSYDIHFYDSRSFRAYYDENNELDRVVIRYSYFLSGGLEGVKKQRWIRLTLTSQWVDREEFETMPSFDSEMMSHNKERFTNSLGFIPCEIARNRPLGKGRDGVGEFNPFRSQIEGHEGDVKSLQENLAFFGHPLLVSTRSPSEIIELVGDKSRNLSQAHTMASQGGWYDAMNGSTRNSLPRHQSHDYDGNAFRIKKVIGNVHPDERFAFLTPDPVSPDHANHVREIRESLHFALGGIDETGIHASATAYEMKVVYGKVATTAMKKATAIYTHGLCKVFEKMLAAEEDLFRRSLAIALGYEEEEIISDGEIAQLIEEGKLPPNVYGLPPLGKRTIEWRWTGPVFEDSPDDLQRKSIVTRNLQELGVRSLDALTFLFPEKTEKEKQGMLAGGYPFRYLNAVAGTTGQLLALYQQMLNLPDLANNGMPLAATTPVTPAIVRSMQTIFNELNYARPTEPLTPADSPYPTGQYTYDQSRAGILPNSGDGSSSTPVLPGSSNYPAITGQGYSLSTNPGIPGSTATLEPYRSSMERSLSVGGQSTAQLPPTAPSEYTRGLPASGSLVSGGSASSTNGYTLTPELHSQWSSSQSVNSESDRQFSLPPDLSVNASTPGSIADQLFPGYAEWLSTGDNRQQGTGNRKSKPKSTTNSKSKGKQ